MNKTLVYLLIAHNSHVNLKERKPLHFGKWLYEDLTLGRGFGCSCYDYITLVILKLEKIIK